MQPYGGWRPTVVLGQPWSQSSATALCAAYGMRTSSADYSQRLSSPTQKRWTSPEAWKQLTRTQNRSSHQILLSDPFLANPLGLKSGDRATAVAVPPTTQPNANLLDAECHHCGKRGHIAPACRSKNQPTRRTQPKPTRNKKHRNTNRVQDDDPTADTGESSGEDYHLHKMGTQSSPPVEVDVVVNGTSLTMEVDTGAAVSIISEKTRRALLPHLKLHASDLVLRTYTEEPIKVIGTLNVRVQYGSQAEKLVLVVVGGDGPSLFGRNWLRYLRLDWNKIASIRSAQLSPLKLLMQQNQSSFADERGTVDPYKAILNVRTDAAPSCHAIKPNPPTAPLHPWVWPDTPWKRIHVDFAGPFQGKMFFIVIDAHSKWPEVVTMSTTTSHTTIEALRSMFARFGLPEQLVSDNGPQFTSTEFAQFMKGNHIKHILCSPYHPSSNGLAERFVQTFKCSMRAGEQDGRSLQHRLSEFLLTYRTSTHATTDTSPSELFLNRKLRTRFDLLKPDTKGIVESRQAEQKKHHDSHSKQRCLFPGTPVMVKDYRHSNKWIRGTILKKLGPVTYTVDVGNGNLWKRHIDQLRKCMESSSQLPATDFRPIDSPILDNHHYPADADTLNPPEPQVPQHASASQPVVSRRYPQRDRHPPDRFMVISES